jgi:hypothetical protein
MEQRGRPGVTKEGAQPEERCTAPHPGVSALWSLPAFALVIAVVAGIVWMLL